MDGMDGGTCPVRDEQLSKLIDSIRRYHPNEDMSLVEKAYNFAKTAHQDQKRKSGEPYFNHPYAVSLILADLMLDATTIAAGLLHDCVEDIEEITIETIEKDFGAEVAVLVDGVTKLSRLNFSTKEEQKIESLRKMFLAMAKDIRVVIIKLADRLHNMRTLKFQPADRQIAIAHETLDIYAPLAHRLGMNAIKWELEDLSLRYIDPEGYYTLVNLVGMKRQEREAAIRGVIETLQTELKNAGIKAEVEGRPKHFYSIYNKMKNQHKTFDQIHDLIAIRVLVNTKQECYFVLGIVHTLWSLVPGRFKDYISIPKANMYQSLHTTVVGKGGMIFEVQIRTYDMHQTAEYGIAAHWRYKGVNQGAQTSEMWLGRLRELLEDTTHSLAQRFDAKPASGEIFVFTPNGDLRKLPEGASLLDFAFDIHTSLGSTCVGGKVNNRAVSIREQLRNGDIVEILTQKNQTPKSDWLNFVVTSKARNKIKSYLREEQAKHTRMGREELERKLKNWKFTLTIDEAVAYLVKYFKVRTGTEVYALIATQKVDLGTIKEILARHISGEADEQRRAAAAEAERNKVHNVKESTAPQDALVIDDDISKIQYKLAKCCNPIKGDDVFGFVTINSGITIHRNDCPNAKRMRENYPYRVIEARWRSTAEGAFRVSIRIVAADTTGMANHITEVISRDLKLNIRSINFSSLANGCIGGTVSVEVPGAGVVDTLIHSIMRIKGVQRAFRINN